MNATAKMVADNLRDVVYSAAMIEGVSCGKAVSDEIVSSGRRSADAPEHDFLVIDGLAGAYRLMLECCDALPDFKLACEYDRLCDGRLDARAGRLREEPITISGTDYVPPVPREGDYERILDAACACRLNDDAAATMLLLTAKAQLFIDGNKRTAQVLANHILVYRDAGRILCVPPEDADLLLNRLSRFYEGAETLADAAYDIGDDWMRAM